MKCYYICPKTVWEGMHESGVPRYALLPGSSYVELGSGFILLLTEPDRDGWDWSINEWHQHPDVARLAHPARERTLPLAQLQTRPDYAHKQFTAQHFQLLQDAFGIQTSDTVWDLHNKLEMSFPGMKLGSAY